MYFMHIIQGQNLESLFKRQSVVENELFQFTTSDYSLRSTNVLVLPQPKTTTYRYAAARIGTRFLILLGKPLVRSFVRC